MRARRRGACHGLRDVPMPQPGEVYLEFHPFGDHMRVVAVDAGTGTEVTIFGPVSVSRHDLARIAARKLQRRLERESVRRSDRFA